MESVAPAAVVVAVGKFGIFILEHWSGGSLPPKLHPSGDRNIWVLPMTVRSSANGIHHYFKASSLCAIEL